MPSFYGPNDTESLIIRRVHNGFMIDVPQRGDAIYTKDIRVAETVPTLTKIVTEWAIAAEKAELERQAKAKPQ